MSGAVPDDDDWLTRGEALLIALEHEVEASEWARALRIGLIRSTVRDGRQFLLHEDVELWARRYGWERPASPQL